MSRARFIIIAEENGQIQETCCKARGCGGEDMSKSKEFSKAVIDELGYYVYIYSDPDTRIPFYIGKGKGNRVFNHLSLDNDSDKVKKIQEIKKKRNEYINN